MRYRALTADGDMTFGRGKSNFLVDSAAMVAQMIRTRLGLWTGEWFLDITEGTPWMTQVLGSNTRKTYDLAIQNRVLETYGVTQITNYQSEVIVRPGMDSRSPARHLRVTMIIDTIFGSAGPIEVTL